MSVGFRRVAYHSSLANQKTLDKKIFSKSILFAISIKKANTKPFIGS